jgi:hypothetical protein
MIVFKGDVLQAPQKGPKNEIWSRPSPASPAGLALPTASFQRPEAASWPRLTTRMRPPSWE